MFTSAELRNELVTDPKGVGYASQLNVSDIATAELLNALSGVGAALVSLTDISHDDMAMLIAPVVMNLSAASTTVQAKWEPMLQLLGGIQNVTLNTLNLGLLAALSADFPNELPASAIAAATSRNGSRAEVLWGVGTMIGWTDVAKSMGRM